MLIILGRKILVIFVKSLISFSLNATSARSNRKLVLKNESSDNNKFSFSAKKNYKTDSTEFYNMSYQYAIDCLTAGVTYRREFYQDADLEPKNTLMFTVTFVPFASVNTPVRNQ